MINNILKISEYFNTIQKQEKPFKFLISKILIRLKLSHLFNFKYKHHVLKFYPTFLSRVLWINPQHSHSGDKTENFIWNYLRRDDVFIDIGANIGTTTLEASKKIGDDGKIFSFEPNPRIFEFLRQNILLNKCKNVKLFNFALGSKPTDKYFSDIYTDESNSVQEDNIGIKVKMKTLDEIIPKEIKIDLIKIDVIGYEKFVFLGARKILENTLCIHFPAIAKLYKKYNYNYKEIFNLLKQHGFIVCTVFTPNILTVLPDDFEPKIGDYIAIKNIDEFLERSNYKLSH